MDSHDAIDVALANVLHSACLPLRVHAERLSRGVYKLSTLERGARARGRPRRVQLVLSPAGLTHVRVGAGAPSRTRYL